VRFAVVRSTVVRSTIASAVLLLVWADHAAADLYRWVDPETGSIKFSSYPPPWYGDEAKQRRAPKVEVIAPMRTAPAVAADFEPPARSREAPRPDQKPAPAPALPERR